MTNVIDLHEAQAALQARATLVDRHVGARVRARRKQIGQSQDQLAEALGLTFQQVQKYEKGINRISASKLHAIAQAQNTPVSFYFADIPGDNDGPPDNSGGSPLIAFSTLTGAIALAEAYISLPASGRRALIHVAGAILDVNKAHPDADVEIPARAIASGMSL